MDLLTQLQTLYFSPLNTSSFTNVFVLIRFVLLLAFLLLFATILQTGVMYFVLNFTNKFPHWKQLFHAILYSFSISFILAKVLQQLFLFTMNLIPLVGSYFGIVGMYLVVVLVGILEYSILLDRLNSYYEQEKIGSEPIDHDVLQAVIVANLLLFLFFFLLKYLS